MNSDKAEGRAVAARKKAALVAAKKLDAAADAVSAFALACAMCADASSPPWRRRRPSSARAEHARVRGPPE